MHAPNDNVTLRDPSSRNIWSRHWTTATPLSLPACALPPVSGWSSLPPCVFIGGWSAALLLLAAAVTFTATFYVLRTAQR